VKKGVQHSKGVALNGCEVITRIDVNAHERCVRFLLWLKKTNLTQMNLKSKVITPREDLGEGWQKMDLSWQGNMLEHLWKHRYIKGGGEWHALLLGLTQVRRASHWDHLSGAPRWQKRLRLNDSFEIQLRNSLSTIHAIRVQEANVNKWRFIWAERMIRGCF